MFRKTVFLSPWSKRDRSLIMRRKPILSLLLTITTATVFSFNSFAAPQQPTKLADDTKVALPAAVEAPPQGDLTGTLTGTGTLMVNGNVVQSGATVTNGSTVATDALSDAVLDLGTLGRIRLRPSTEIRLRLSPGRCEVDMTRCGSLTQVVPKGVTAVLKPSSFQVIQVASTAGEARVRGQAVIENKGAAPANTVSARMEDYSVIQDESRSFDKIEEITATDATFTVNCCECGEVAKAATSYSPYGWLALLGAATGIILGVTAGDNDGGDLNQQVSPIR
jgi:hypothetical protein